MWRVEYLMKMVGVGSLSWVLGGQPGFWEIGKRLGRVGNFPEVR